MAISGSLLLLLAISSLSAAGKPREALPVDLLEQWQKIKSESPDTGRVTDLLAEGERIILRLQELEDLRHDPQNPPGENFNQRVQQLQDRFKDLLRRIEMARVVRLPDGEIQAMRDRYEQERAQLQIETRALEDSIIARGEIFLATYKQNINYSHYLSKQEMIVDFLYRLAEIYYQRGEEEFFAANDIAAFKPALEKYQRIIDEFPASDYVDDALYNIAYVKNSSRVPDDQQEAIKLYKTLIEKYSTSPFVAEAYWRVGEYYFYQEPAQTAEAINFYAALLNYPDTHWYARGLYKIGWCHFRNAEYPQAIDYFTRTVEASLDSAAAYQDVLFASMLDEALEYISVCYAQEESEWSGAGVAAAVAFVQADSIRLHTYGERIIEYLGDIHKFQLGKYDKAVEAYQAHIHLYPLSPKAPWVQEKIINLYAANLRDFPRAYDEKDLLFQAYRAGTDWDKANPDSALRSAANVIIEKYYTQNISETIGRALQTNDRSLLERSVQMSRNYLEFFPQGPNAYTVNFNLAVLLERNLAESEQAYAEFLKVSKDYPDDKHRKESAVNAAIIAQKLINAQGAPPADSLLTRPLSDPEAKYVAAAENYLNLFPQGEEAELFLLNTGALYYKHGLYPDSRKYYERLLADFPEGSRRGEAYRFLMNGYFAEGNYPEAERIAKEIQAAGADSSLLADAKTRQAESVFLGAQGYKQNSDFLGAAQEFKRAALESPDYGQADKALFESGLAFQQAKAWKEAIEVCTLLVQRYPKSELADKALYNVAYNSQAELGDKALAAATFERLAREYPTSPLAQDALRNASINYSEAGDWAGAIRTNTAYTQMFAAAPDANLFLFENAGLYLKLGDEVSAEQIYADYTRRYPNDPRAVRAHWERGSYLLHKARSSEAYTEFTAGLQTHRRMLAAGSPGEETYASRCLLEVVRADFQTYEAIQFAPANQVEANKQTKLARRDLLLAQLEELNRMGKDEMFEGLYSVGKLEEDLSRAFAGQELPAKGSAEEKILTRETANQDAIEIALRAINAYRKAAEDIAAAAGILQAKQAELQTRREALSAWVMEAQKTDPQPPALPDSTAALAELDRGQQEVQTALENAASWSRRTKDKVPELALSNAEIKLSTVKAFLALPDAGKNDDLKMLYRAGVLSEFAAPRGAEVVRLYRQALAAAATSEEADTWKSKSLAGINELFSLLETEFRALNERPLTAYSQYYAEYQSLLKQGEGATTRQGQQAADVAEKLVFYSNQSADYARAALTAQSTLLSAAEEGEEIPPEVRSRLAASTLEEVFRLNDRYASLAADANTAKTSAQDRQSQSVVWEDAVMTYEDCAYNYTGHQEALLNTAYEFNQQHGADQPLSLRLARALAALDREKYLPLLAQYGVESWVRSDETFLVRPDYLAEWDCLDCPREGWIAPLIVAHTGHEADELAQSKPVWLSRQVAQSTPDSLALDSLQEPAVAVENVPYDSLYLRKTFEISEEPVAGELWISSEGGFAVQLNGELIGALEPGQPTADPLHYEVAQLLKSGGNVLTILALDSETEHKGVMIALKYKVLPAPSFGGP